MMSSFKLRRHVSLSITLRDFTLPDCHVCISLSEVRHRGIQWSIPVRDTTNITVPTEKLFYISTRSPASAVHESTTFQQRPKREAYKPNAKANSLTGIFIWNRRHASCKETHSKYAHSSLESRSKAIHIHSTENNGLALHKGTQKHDVTWESHFCLIVKHDRWETLQLSCDRKCLFGFYDSYVSSYQVILW